jgi:diacylglycerol kinase (ATP)
VAQQPAGSHAAGAAGPYAGRTFIILNPAAGQDDQVTLRRTVGGAFAARGVGFDLVATERAGHATTLAAEAAARGYAAVCIVGGDGTLAEAATGLAGTGVPLAIVPAGTGNQVAQGLGIPVDIEQAVEIAVHGRAAELDLGRANGRAFALVAGAGLDAAVMARATRDLKERWGFAAYIYAMVKEALNATPAEFHIVADGREIRATAIGVMLANAGELIPAFVPLRFPLSPEPAGSWEDGVLDVVILAPRRLTQFPAVLWRAANRQFQGDEQLVHFQARQVRIEATPPIPIQIDGDPAGMTPLEAVATPRQLRLMVPR